MSMAKRSLVVLYTHALVWLLGWAMPQIAMAAPQGNEYERATALLASQANEGILKAVALLGAAEHPEGLAILEALQARQLKIDAAGVLFAPADLEAKSELVTIRAELRGQAPRDPLRPVPLNNAIRREVERVLAQLRLSAEDITLRRTAAEELAAHPSEETVELLRGRLGEEPDAAIRDLLRLGVAKVELSAADPALRRAAIETIGELGDVSMLDPLRRLVQANPDGSFSEADASVRAAGEAVLSKLERRRMVFNLVANTVYGLSLASVLLLAALGLAITFGLMGVINMAHGEMLMLGAYATYFTQGVFSDFAPAYMELYLLAAIPFAFFVTAAVGILLERSVIRRLYGRPLETLLATWGLSLILIQIVRLLFGAQNVAVANPSWLSGGWSLLPSVVVPYSRIAVLLFTAVVVTFVWMVLQRTSLGLRVRAVTQNRSMAAGIGISTQRVDMWTFGLGSGVAGLGGVALSQLGNVGPELGRQHIIDSFMVVVLGGVGNLLGTILGSLGLGLANKFLEPVTGSVLGKIFILGLLILFIQRRPQGLFALKGRAAED